MSSTIRIYWNFLVIFGVLCQGIIGTISEEDIDESSELLVRQKRVINRAPGEDRKVQIKDFPFMVMIKHFRLPTSCAGVIVKANIVLTTAKCVQYDTVRYKVYSGSGKNQSYGGNPKVHDVPQRRIFLGNHPFRSGDGIALLTVSPPFIFSRSTRVIDFFQGHIQPGSHAIVSGWGCHTTGERGTKYPEYLRTISASVISTEECRILYQNQIAISPSDICTHDSTGLQYCTVEDVGAPLLIQHNNMFHLVGIHLFKGEVGRRNNPEVFANLQNPRYKEWLWETIPILEAGIHT